MVAFKIAFVGFSAWLLFQHIPPGLADPSPPDASLSHTPSAENSLLRRADPQDFYLRIMPLGASITAGARPAPNDTERNGYREFLHDKLRHEGWKVNMVGNYTRGDMADNGHEGVAGERVSQVHERAAPSLSIRRPNVVLINAGTNDASQDGKHEPVSAVKRNMKVLIDDVFVRVPETVVVLSTLIPSTVHPENIDYINDEYRSLYRDYVPLDNEGNEIDDPPSKVVFAEMDDGFITVKDIHDGIHPTLKGQRKMATVWDRAINKANEKGWLSPATDTSNLDDGDDGGAPSSGSPSFFPQLSLFSLFFPFWLFLSGFPHSVLSLFHI